MPELNDVSEEPDTGDRYYTWDDGAEYPSVTTITGANPEKKKTIEAWRESHPNPDHYRDRQGQLGRLVHRRVLNQYSIRNLPPESVDFDLVDDEFQADVETAVGLGGRFRFTDDGVHGRLDLAYSPTGLELYMSLGEAF